MIRSTVFSFVIPVVWLASLAYAPLVQGAVTLAPVFGSHMVLQSDLPLTVWGTADSGEQVTVSFDQHSAVAMPDAKGQWRVTLPAPSPDGKAHALSAKGSTAVVLEDILIGEVWLGSGQSNMARAGTKVGEAGRLPGIRLMRDDGWVPARPRPLKRSRPCSSTSGSGSIRN